MKVSRSEGKSSGQRTAFISLVQVHILAVDPRPDRGLCIYSVFGRKNKNTLQLSEEHRDIMLSRSQGFPGTRNQNKGVVRQVQTRTRTTQYFSFRIWIQGPRTFSRKFTPNYFELVNMAEK